MGTADQPITQPADHPAPPPADRGTDWVHLFSRRSMALGGLAFATRLAVVGISLADPDALHRRTLLTMDTVSAIVGLTALLSLAADVVAARRTGYWGGYAACADDLRGVDPDPSGDNVIDLSTRRPRRRTAAREADAEPALPAAPVTRRHVAGFAILALLLAGLVVSALWPRDSAKGDPPAGHSPFAAPPASASSLTPSTPGAAPSGSSTSTRPGQPTVAPSTGPGVSPGAIPAAQVQQPSTDPIGDGTYRVGVDIAAGAWSSGGAVNLTLGCWYRVNGGAAVKVPLSVGPATVRLHTGDLFATGGCKSWSWSE